MTSDVSPPRVTGCARESTSYQVCGACGSSWCWKEAVGACHLHGDGGQHVQPHPWKYSHQVPWQVRDQHAPSHGVQGISDGGGGRRGGRRGRRGRRGAAYSAPLTLVHVCRWQRHGNPLWFSLMTAKGHL